jgi:type II secretory pathway component PulF
VAQFYDREVPETIQRSITWFNAAVLVFMGATVAMIALSFFVPLYEVLGNVNAN